MKWLWTTLLILAFTSPVAARVDITRAYPKAQRAYAVVTYTNDSGKRFKNVTIKCTAYNSNGNAVGVNTRSFFYHEYGYINPGFSDSVVVPVAVHGAAWSTIGCRAIER